jgi:carboxyl-terminal processing protease
MVQKAIRQLKNRCYRSGGRNGCAPREFPPLPITRRASMVCQNDASVMKRRIFYGLVIVVLGVNLLLGARIYLTSAEAANKDNPYPSLELFSYVVEKVRKDYVDGQDVSYKDLVYGALKGMLNTLDPHSEFLEPVKFKELQNDTQGSFGGLGIVISMRDNFVTVIAPMEDTPGFKAGILSGDRIIRIDGKSTERMSLQEAVKNLRGEAGTEVAITILRPSSGLVKEFKLTRAVINIDMVKDLNGRKEFPLDGDKVGYIRLVQFGEKTSEDLDTALKKLKAQGVQGLVLDLRGNPGGLLEQAVDVCEKFLPRGKLVVTTEGRTAAQNSRRLAMGRGDQLTHKDGTPMPMVILVNLGSASASEIVAGCLQDSKRAIILGEKTFGKGSVQSILPLQDGAALRLTTAKYYTPSHKVIHGEGITPDIIVPMTDDEEMALHLKRTPGGIESLEEKDRERVRNARDPQLDRAMDLLRGITLFTERAPNFDKRDSEPEKVAAK